MSIIDHIRVLVDGGTLFHVMPIEPGRSTERDVFVSKDVWEFLQGNAEGFETVGLRAYRRIETFICGNRIVFGMDPLNKHSSCLIARNDEVQEGVVDVRVNDPQPAVRLFGCFAAQNVLVLLIWRSRSLLKNKGFAGSIRECKAQWASLFPKFRPLISDSPHDYITGTFDLG